MRGCASSSLGIENMPEAKGSAVEDHVETADGHAREVAAGERFPFGRNWARFLARLSDQRIAAAEASLRAMLGIEDLRGLRFLDVGSGSGLFSLAARRLGAIVHSFDFDSEAVACTRELRRRFYSDNDPHWVIEQGSVLDGAFLHQRGEFDIVYSWGVLHHTGDVWRACDLVAKQVVPRGKLYVALYNDQGWLSRYWRFVKRAYNSNCVLRGLLIAVYTPYFVWLRWFYRTLTRKGPVGRGMSLWFDMLDWLGGYPFEVARPEDASRFFEARGFRLERFVATGANGGCNEYVFRRAEEEGGSWERT